MAFSSTNILDFNYDVATKKMKVYFLSGGLHEFDEVSYQTYSDFLNAKSKGQYFTENIKDKFTSKKIY